jgi:hypothetical protein
VSPQSAIQAWLSDKTGVDTNSLVLTIGANAPVTLKDPRLSYSGGVLTYSPGTNEFFGTNGDFVIVGLSAADTLGNRTTNFTWSFRLELTPVLSDNIIIMGSSGGDPCNLNLLSMNGSYFTFGYTGGV